MGTDTIFKIGDSVWTSELSDGDGWYHTFNRTVKYIRNMPSGIVYGFVYDIECTEDQCFHTKGMADFATETWNNKMLKKVTN